LVRVSIRIVMYTFVVTEFIAGQEMVEVFAGNLERVGGDEVRTKFFMRSSPQRRVTVFSFVYQVFIAFF